jgi:hypothetical protein
MVTSSCESEDNETLQPSALPAILKCNSQVLFRNSNFWIAHHSRKQRTMTCTCFGKLGQLHPTDTHQPISHPYSPAHEMIRTMRGLHQYCSNEEAPRPVYHELAPSDVARICTLMGKRSRNVWTRSGVMPMGFEPSRSSDRMALCPKQRAPVVCDSRPA